MSTGHQLVSDAPARGSLSPEVELSECAQRYRSLFQYNLHAAFSLDLEGRYVDVNPVTERLTGYTREELCGMRFTEVICQDDLPRIVEAFRAAIRREPQYQETAIQHKDGRFIELRLTAVPVVVGDVVVGVHGVAEDVTEANELRRELERARRVAEEATAAKSLFLANMSHEVRTPLTSVIAAAELLTEANLDPYQSRLAGTVNRSVGRLRDLVTDLLDFSRLEAGAVEMHHREVKLTDLVEETVASLAATAQDKGLELTHDVGSDVPEVVFSDTVRISQVLTNLLANAVKFTDHGSVRLTVRATPPTQPTLPVEGQGAVGVSFAVEDTGIGIPAEKQAVLFQPFTQVDAANTRASGGAGLGLAICHDVVHLLGGSLWVDSAEGAGSTFGFTLPLEVPTGDAGKAEGGWADEAEAGVGGHAAAAPPWSGSSAP